MKPIARRKRPVAPHRFNRLPVLPDLFDKTHNEIRVCRRLCGREQYYTQNISLPTRVLSKGVGCAVPTNRGRSGGDAATRGWPPSRSWTGVPLISVFHPQSQAL